MKKFLSFIATSAILLNSFYAPLTAIAQEITPSPEPTPEATSTPEPTQTPEETIVPSEEPTVTPEATPTEIASPTPEVIIPPTDTGSPEPTEEAGQETQPQAPESNPTTTSPPEDSPTIEPTFTPAVTDENAVVSTQVVITEMIPETLLENNVIKLITDKLDYSPTEMAIISGSGFIPEKTYSLMVSSSDDPATSTTVDVTVNGNGEFTYGYQLDGNYRPNYLVEVKDGEELVASTTFTDSESGTTSLPFTETFGTGGSDVNEIPGWYDRDGSSSDTRIESGEGQSGRSARVDAGDWVCRTFSSTGLGSLELQYYWIGDSDAGGSDDGHVQYKLGGNCSDTDEWTEISSNNLNTNTGSWIQETNSLSSSLNNTTFRLRFYNDSNDSDEDYRIDTISITGTTLVSQPDLTVNKTNDTSGNGEIGTTYNWIVTLTNEGNAAATFGNSNIVLTDELPINALYGTPSVTLGSGVTGIITCSVSNNTLTCTSGAGLNVLSIPVNTSVTITLPVTPSVAGTITNPRDQGLCSIDPISDLAESNESNNNCNSNSVTIEQGPSQNPKLTQSCGIDVVLVVDTSTSIDNNELATMKTALKSFVNTFMGTPTQMAVVSFDDWAVLESGWTNDLSTLTESSGVIDDIDGSGYTNWEDALHDSRLLFPNRAGVPDLIVFTSDGDPTDSDGPLSDLNDAITQADLAKGDGIRIITLGIGGSINQSNLVDISSADAYYSAATFDDLEDELHGLVVSLCGGTVTARKLVDGQPSSGWNFSIDGNNYSTDSDGYTKAVSVDPGTYNIVETPQTGHSFASASCNGATNNGTQGANSVDGIVVGANDIVSCIFNNHALPQTGHLIVQKTTNPSGDQTAFPISASGSGTITGGGLATVTDATDHDYEVTPGTYSVSENEIGGWIITENTCNNITVEAGEIHYCQITNSKASTIHIYKDSIPDKNQPFTFSMTGSTVNIPAINLYDIGDANRTFSVTGNLAGDYVVNEGQVSGWKLTNISCTGTTQYTENLTSRQLTIYNVSPGSDISCTFTNIKTGSISGTKFEDLNGSGERDYHWENDTPIYDEPGIPGWEIYIDSNKDGDWDADEPKTTTDADGNYSFNGLTGDDKRVREIGKPGWIQTSTDPQDQPVSNGNDWANINFGNFELASISGIKYNDLNGNGSKDPGENGLSGWTIVIDKNNNQVFDAGDLSTTTDSNGNYSFTNLTRGTYHGYTYIVMEIPQAGWTPVNPADGIQYVQILSGTNATNINFGNKRDTGTITIIKDAVNNSSKDFSFDTNMPGLGGDFDLEDDGNNSDGHKNYITRTVPVGSYWIREDGENGWKMTDISCSGDGSSSINENEQKVDISLKANENVTCTFTNTELAKVFGYKFKDENTNGNWDWHHPYYERALGNWRIFIDDGNGIYDGTEPSRITNNWLWYIPFWTGYYEFDNLLPGTYSICEEPQSGWTNVTPVCRTVELTPGSNHITNFGNIDNGTVTVTKFNDENQNGIFDNDESTLNGWTINLDQDSLTTGENGQNEGQVLFTNVTQGDHGLNENIQEGWRQTNIYCDRVSDGLFSVNAQSISILPIASYIVHVVAGQNVNCYVGNFEENPGISITKTNDKSGGTFAGDTITYTLSVKNTGNINLDLLKVTDYLPGGFSYVPGSTSGAITSDPSLEASSLTWILDSIAVNETKTISYKVLVSSDVSSGTHTNYATCEAIKSGPTDLKFTRLVADISTDQIDDVVYCNTSSSSVSVGNGLSYGGSLGGQVLGASTMLPATGNPTWMLFGALGLTATGIYLNIRSKKENKHAKN